MVARCGAQKNLRYTSQNVLGVFGLAFELEREKVVRYWHSTFPIMKESEKTWFAYECA